MACWGPCGGCGAQGTHPGGFMSAGTCTAHVVLGRCCTSAMIPGHLTICVRVYPRASSGALSQAGPFHGYPPTPKTPQIPQQISVPFVFQSLLLACFNVKETSVQMSYLELGWSKHSLCLTSKSCEQRKAELLCTTPTLASQAPRVTL